MEYPIQSQFLVLAAEQNLCLFGGNGKDVFAHFPILTSDPMTVAATSSNTRAKTINVVEIAPDCRHNQQCKYSGLDNNSHVEESYLWHVPRW